MPCFYTGLPLHEGSKWNRPTIEHIIPQGRGLTTLDERQQKANVVYVASYINSLMSDAPVFLKYWLGGELRKVIKQHDMGILSIKEKEILRRHRYVCFQPYMPCRMVVWDHKWFMPNSTKWTSDFSPWKGKYDFYVDIRNEIAYKLYHKEREFLLQILGHDNKHIILELIKPLVTVTEQNKVWTEE